MVVGGGESLGGGGKGMAGKGVVDPRKGKRQGSSSAQFNASKSTDTGASAINYLLQEGLERCSNCMASLRWHWQHCIKRGAEVGIVPKASQGGMCYEDH